MLNKMTTLKFESIPSQFSNFYNNKKGSNKHFL